MFGLFLATKQHTPLMAPAVLLFLPRPLRWRDIWQVIWKAGLVVFLVNLPFLIWDPLAFIRFLVAWPLNPHFRPDSLSYVAWIAAQGGPEITSLGLPAAVTAVVLALAYLVLAIRENIACWFAAILSTSIYIVLMYKAGLYMESALQLFYIAMAVYGWYSWKHGEGPENKLPV